MKVLVTGGAGFIGSHYVRLLLAGAYPRFADAAVIVVDKLTYAGSLRNLPLTHPRLTFIEADVCDREPLVSALAGVDTVVHFAAESHVDRSLVRARDFVVTNVVGTQNLLDCCRHTGVRLVVHVSTDEVYGSVSRGRSTEQDRFAPSSPYAASKAAGELLANAYHTTYGLPVCVTRGPNTYGPYQFAEKIIPLFVTNLLDGREVPLYGDGLNIREWLHVEDHCAAIQLVAENGRPGQAYNIGPGTELTNRELTARLVRLCGAEWRQVRHVADRMGHDRRYAMDCTKIREELGFTARIPIDEGLASAVRWYCENREWWEGTAPAANGPSTPLVR